MLDISIPYRAWKNTLQMWTLVCVVNKKEQGMLILLTRFLTIKKAKIAVSNLTSVELYTENGLNLLLEKLDASFQSEYVEDVCIFFLI